jgi:hypothetical protein
MKASVINNLSTYILWALIAVSVVVCGVFFFVGFDNYSTINGKSLVDPVNTDLLIYWMYALVAAGIVLLMIFVLKQFLVNLKDSPMTAVKGLLGALLVVALFGVAYAVASAEPIKMADGKLFEEQDKLILSDICIYVQYVLLAVATLCTALSLMNVSKSVNKVKA